MGCVVITGCSSGIGLATAVAFGRRGDTVVAGVRRADSVAVVDEACAGLSVEAIRLDVTSIESVRAAVVQILERHDTIDVLVNNAGIGTIAPLEETSEEVYRALFETNVYGPIAMMQAVLPHMRAAGTGTVVNVGSILGRVATPFQSIYCATKFAVSALTDSAHLEVSPFGVRVCTVEPGRILTSFQSNLLGGPAGSEAGPVAADTYQSLLARWNEGWSTLPGRDRLATAEEVADAVLAACEPDAPRRISVGNDSIMLSAKREALDPEAFDAHLRQATGYLDT